MPLVRVPAPSIIRTGSSSLRDGFRALAIIDGHHCRLVSRRSHPFTKFTLLAEEIAHSVRSRRAVLDGEIVCVGPDGRSRFYDLMFRRTGRTSFNTLRCGLAAVGDAPFVSETTPSR